MALPPWLPPALDYAEQWLGYQMRASETPGCSFAVAHQGRVVLERAFGHADLGAGTKLTPRHRFRVASHSKSFTAAAILKLRERGLLKLDDTVGAYVEGLHPDIADATIAQLLSHSAGIFRDGTDCGYWNDRAPFPSSRPPARRSAAGAEHRRQHPVQILQPRLRPGRPGDRGDHRRAVRHMGKTRDRRCRGAGRDHAGRAVAEGCEILSRP